MRKIKIELVIVLLLLIASNTLGQTNAAGKTPQYLFKSFSKGNVLKKNDDLHTAVMNYNTLTDNIVFEQDGELLNLSNLDIIDTIYLQNSRFIPIGKAFYEVIATSPLPLFIQHKGKLLPPGHKVAYGGTSQVAATQRLSMVQGESSYYNLPMPADFKVKITPVYWLNIDGEMVNFINMKQLLKLFPEKKNEIKKLIKKERLKFENREDLVKIISLCAENTE